MKRLQFLVLAACLLFCTGLLAQEQKKYALLIGINKYTSSSLIKKELQFAKDDAISMEKLLFDRGWDTTPVVDSAADRERIIRELYRLSLKATPNDKVLIYFAGHGVRDIRGNGRTYWVTTDATVENLISDGIRLNHIIEYINEIGAQEKILILDHCYSGDFDAGNAVDGNGQRDITGEATIQVNERDLFPEEVSNLQNVTPNGLVIFAAARGPAYEDPDFGGHGMFTKALLDVLNNPQSDNSPRDGRISLNEMWTQMNTSIEQMAAAKNLEQRPFSNAGINQLNWHMFDAAVEDFTEQAIVLTSLLSEIESVARANLDWDIKSAYLTAITDMKTSVEEKIEPDVITRQLIQALTSIQTQGVDGNSLASLASKHNELFNQ